MKILSDLGYTDNAIALAQAKGRSALDSTQESQLARQKANGMNDGFDYDKIKGISLKARQEKKAADDAAEALTAQTPAAESTKVEETPVVPAKEPKAE